VVNSRETAWTRHPHHGIVQGAGRPPTVRTGRPMAVDPRPPLDARSRIRAEHNLVRPRRRRRGVALSLAVVVLAGAAGLLLFGELGGPPPARDAAPSARPPDATTPNTAPPGRTEPAAGAAPIDRPAAGAPREPAVTAPGPELTAPASSPSAGAADQGLHSEPIPGLESTPDSATSGIAGATAAPGATSQQITVVVPCVIPETQQCVGQDAARMPPPQVPTARLPGALLLVGFAAGPRARRSRIRPRVTVS
jgi:hypothetical protein